ncbi:MAG: phosphate signaling complex protein PhoU [Methylococcales bacterium]|nr:phosphate signaling complex protein PhoU [Methylococcales bacterium]
MEIDKFKKHTSSQFNKDMDAIRSKLLLMGGLVELQIENAGKAFMLADMELAEQVLQQESVINQGELDIDRECVEILAKRQPIAIDLRLVLATIHIIRDLERIGDEASRIAKMAIHIQENESLLKPQQYYEIHHLVNLVKAMLHQALDAFARLELDAVVAIKNEDINVDREYGSIVRQLISRMMEDPRNVRRALDVLWTVRSLERIGDHVCNICEHVIYIVKGEDVRHISQEELAKRALGW